MRILVAVGCMTMFAVGSAWAADRDRAAPAYGYDRVYARIEPACFEGGKPATRVLHCPPQVVLPIAPETYYLQESYLELGHPYRKPYRQLFSW